MKTKEKTVDSYREVVGSCLYEYLKMNLLKGEKRKFQRKKIITLIKERLLMSLGFY